MRPSAAEWTYRGRSTGSSRSEVSLRDRRFTARHRNRPCSSSPKNSLDSSARSEPPNVYRGSSHPRRDDAFHDRHSDAVSRHRRHGSREQRRVPLVHRARAHAVLHEAGAQEDAGGHRFHLGPCGHRFRIPGGLGRRDPGHRLAIENWDVLVHVLARAKSVQVSYDYDKKKSKPIPPEFRRLLEDALED